MSPIRPLPTLTPGQRVRVTQQITTREGPWTTQIEGRVVDCKPKPTGSWFAHGKNDRLWLQRLRLALDDGELIDLTLDTLTDVTILEPAPK